MSGRFRGLVLDRLRCRQPRRGGTPATGSPLGCKLLIYKVLAQLAKGVSGMSLATSHRWPAAWDRHWRRKLHVEEMRDARVPGDPAGTRCGERGLVVYAERRSRFRRQRQWTGAPDLRRIHRVDGRRRLRLGG